MQKSIEKWIDKFVSVHNEKLGTVPCPYARNALINYVKTNDIRKSLEDYSVDFNDDYQVVCLYTPTKNYTPKELSDIEFRNVVIDSSLFTEATGWKPEYDFDSGLIAAYQSYFPK